MSETVKSECWGQSIVGGMSSALCRELVILHDIINMATTQVVIPFSLGGR